VQVVDGVTGYKVSSVEECAERVVELLSDQKAARRIGRASRTWVREHYLMPRLLRDTLSLYRGLLRSRAGSSGAQGQPATAHHGAAA
jgi:trehalose synthase